MFGYDGSIFLRALTGLPLDESKKERSFEIGLCIVNLLGIVSIGVKKIIEKRKSQLVIPIVRVTAPESILPSHQKPNQNIGNSQHLFFNNVAYNKPLLSLLPTIALSMTMIAFYAEVFLINYFEPDKNSKELTGTYYILLQNITADLVLPLFYALWNKDYQNHIKYNQFCDLMFEV